MRSDNVIPKEPKELWYLHIETRRNSGIGTAIATSGCSSGQDHYSEVLDTPA
jgi:hypothetical protein